MKGLPARGVVALSFCLSVALSSVAAAKDYQIAFVVSDKGLYVMNHRGSDRRRLSDDTTAVLGDGAWSPDGQRIVFFSLRREDAALLQKYDLPFHLPMYVVNVDGSNRRRLLDVPVLPD